MLILMNFCKKILEDDQDEKANAKLERLVIILDALNI